MLKSSKRVLQISSALGFVLLLGQTSICYSQDASPTPAPAQDTPAPITSAVPSPATIPAPPPTPIVEPKLANSVAVLDLIVREEYRDFFYDEKHHATTARQNNETRPMETAAAEGTTTPPMQPTKEAPSQSESTYSKQYGIRTSVSYREINGVMTDIRTALRNAGYTVIRPNGSLAKKMRAGEYTTVKDRMNAGDFGRAQYVLIPNVIDASVNEMHNAIAGTSDYMKKFEMNLMVEFTMVNTETQEVIASFNAFGSGSDAYIGKEHVKHVPNFARVRRELLSSFSADAKEKLREQLPPTYTGKPLSASPEPEKTPANIFEQGDPKTLKVYRPEDGKEVKKPAVEKQGEVTIYRQ